MKSILLLPLISCSFLGTLASQCSSISLYTQQQVDSFPTYGCDTVDGDLIISGFGITSLDSLVVLKYVSGNINIDSTSIELLTGFDSLVSVVGYLSIVNCTSLWDLDALNGINSVGQLSIYRCHSLDSIYLNSFSYTTGIGIGENDGLIYLHAANNLALLDGGIVIENNPLLNAIRVLQNAVYCNGINIYDNPSLQFIDTMSQLRFIRYLNISNNDGLVSWDCTPNLVIQTEGQFVIANNNSLTNIEFPKLRQVNDLFIYSNPELSECCFIYNLIVNGTITDALSVADNDSLCFDLNDILVNCELNDPDQDLIQSTSDNCPFISNPEQTDYDADGVGNACDNCPNESNPDQIDTDGDGIGDVCQLDAGNGEIEVLDADIYISNPLRGVIIKTSSGNCYRIRVDDDGRITSRLVQCPD